MWGKSGAEVSSFRDELVGADICKIPKVESFDSVFTFPRPFFRKADLAFQNNMAGLQIVNTFPKINIKLQEQSTNKKLFKT